MNKHLIVSGIVVLLICVGLSGCEEINNEINSEKIDINGDYITQTVHNTKSPIKIDIFGDYCEITVTEETNLIEIEIFGDFNTVRVSKSHSFSQDLFGNGNEIVCYD